MPPGPASHIQARLARVRANFAGKKIDAHLLTTHQDLGYVTGVAWEDTVGLLEHDRLTLVSDFRYQTQLRELSPWANIVIRKKESMAEAVANLLLSRAAGKRVGFESNHTLDGVVRLIHKKMKESAKGRKPAKLVPLQNFMVNQRKAKDAMEIAIIRKAIAAAEGAYAAVRRNLKVGMTENEVAGLMDYEMRRRGASSGSFETNVGAGPNSALPHYRPGEVKIANDQPLLFDWGARLGFYVSDITRTHFFGRPSVRMREVYKTVLEAQKAAISAIKPGLSTRKADKVARDIIKKAGYGKDFGHGLGHGIGLNIHELPQLSQNGIDEPLQPGMVVTVEPGIYLAGEGGVRIEDDVLVTQTGCEVLTSLDKSYEGAFLG